MNSSQDDFRWRFVDRHLRGLGDAPRQASGEEEYLSKPATAPQKCDDSRDRHGRQSTQLHDAQQRRPGGTRQVIDESEEVDLKATGVVAERQERREPEQDERCSGTGNIDAVSTNAMAFPAARPSAPVAVVNNTLYGIDSKSLPG
ncbi:MAG TPA: hypothetical protein VNY84_15245 [Acidimicrobiales bacterium]|nr:hypothetical protein [Acidimicrobiales bacterium]